MLLQVEHLGMLEVLAGRWGVLVTGGVLERASLRVNLPPKIPAARTLVS